MKKKVLAAALAGVFAFSLAACGSSDSSSSSSSGDGSAAGETAEEETTEESASEEEITFESLTVMDNDDLSIVITGIEADKNWGFTLDAEIENKTSDTSFWIFDGYAYVNGVYFDPIFSDTVTAGNSAVEEIDFTGDSIWENGENSLEENGIETITEMEIVFLVANDDTGDTLYEETVYVYPFGEENAVAFERESQDTDVVLVDNDNVSVTVIQSGDDDDDGYYEVNVYCENKSDVDLYIGADEASVNGYMADPFLGFGLTIEAGKCAFDTIYWEQSELEEIGIADMNTEIESIQLLMYAYDDTWETDYIAETVTLNP